MNGALRVYLACCRVSYSVVSDCFQPDGLGCSLSSLIILANEKLLKRAPVIGSCACFCIHPFALTDSSPAELSGKPTQEAVGKKGDGDLK